MTPLRPNDPRTDPPLPFIESLVDHLRAALPLVGRLKVTARQAQQDAADAEIALEHAVGLLRSYLRDEQVRQRSRRSLSDPKDGAR